MKSWPSCFDVLIRVESGRRNDHLHMHRLEREPDNMDADITGSATTTVGEPLRYTWIAASALLVRPLARFGSQNTALAISPLFRVTQPLACARSPPL